MNQVNFVKNILKFFYDLYYDDLIGDPLGSCKKFMIILGCDGQKKVKMELVNVYVKCHKGNMGNINTVQKRIHLQMKN